MENLKLAGASGEEAINNPVFRDTPLGSLYRSTAGDPSNFLTIIISNLITFSFVAGSVIFLFMFIAGAIQWISSGGDKGAVESARGRITNGLVGIVLLFSAFALINLVEEFFGINILTIDIAPLVIE